ncbi:hypothetical protein VCRA2120E330_50057 [Vibrio crassostreae]|nr:hypothetical protein VCRA2113O200_50095 [Vibrio crassostreae]CAK3573175.1 hypothetical protein VCRA2120E330_50057 [Vibrio crassostreae]CAK3664030.1 hypothetical protein VCRA2122O340_50059 [Vibrio crassostreae]CAK3960339.1 hypothetical protein VCRA2128O346_50059 [Vibrio crassostreae]CAK4014441.1 hypothetical protein VCRA2120O254_60097 [Vibrio crassostreae]
MRCNKEGRQSLPFCAFESIMTWHLHIVTEAHTILTLVFTNAVAIT